MKNLLIMAAAVTAACSAWSPGYAAGRLAEVAIVDRDSGSRIETHYFRGEYWVAGVPGARYSIELRNRLDGRLLAVTSVDGVNIVSGETANWDQSGYVLDPGQRYAISGWRKSDAEVAAFAFTAPANSYAERTGRPANLGVIGVAVFRERPAAPQRPPVVSRAEPAAAPAGSAMTEDAATEAGASAREAESVAATRSRALLASARLARAPALGTAHGERETSYVEHTDFTRAQATPDEVIRIRYDSLDNLVAMGVIARPRLCPTRPNPFPGSSPQQYVPDPPRG